MMTLLLEVIYPASFIIAILSLLTFLIVIVKKMNGIKKEMIEREDMMTEVGAELKKLHQMVLGAIEDHYSPNNLNSDTKVNYNYANRILQSGGGIDEIVNSCGLSRSEAELLAALQTNK